MHKRMELKCSWMLIVMLSITASLSAGQPVPEEDDGTRNKKDEGALFNLPFLQFGNGGVRVNFAGYHAEAGLGGLLGGSGSKGGLYASAGTPYGQHASAGLGGDIDGNKGGGLLRARAGVGHGGPEAAAGLGGNLDGSSRNGGRLYAGATNGINTKVVSKEIGVDQTNIQTIPKKGSLGEPEKLVDVTRREINVEDDKVNAVEPISIPVPTDTPNYAYPTRRCRRKRLCNNLVRKAYSYQKYAGNQLPPDFIDESPLPGFEANAQIDKAFVPEVSAGASVSGGVYAAASAQKDVTAAPGSTQGSTEGAGNAQGSGNPQGHPQGHLPPPPPFLPGAAPPLYPRKRTIFDDIFNIPISTLAAVNQLLNAKVG